MGFKLKKKEPDKWKYVSKEFFMNFIQNYPRKLKQDFYMDWYSWNDFSDGRKWPESMIAICQDDDYFGHTFKIKKEYFNESLS